MDQETFNKIKQQAMNEVIEKFFSNSPPSQKLVLQHFLEDFLNSFMKAERTVFLDKDPDNKANGFYQRNLSSGSFRLNLQVPRDRKGDFRPHILPDPYKRTDENYTDLLMSLVVNGYSESQLRASLKELELPYSEEELDKIRDQLMDKLTDFKQRELPEDAFALFIDGYCTEVKENGRVRKACVYIVLGLDLDGKKDIYGFYTFFGDENRADWLKVFNDLNERGLKRVVVIVSDDFPGMDGVIKALYPKTDHQLCYVHLQRNVRKNMGKGMQRYLTRN